MVLRFFCLVIVALTLTFSLQAFSADNDAALLSLLAKPAHDVDAETRAKAIDQLAKDHIMAAIPVFIWDCLTDTRALMGSDNWVGGHAANALEELTGQHFGADVEKWQSWYLISHEKACKVDAKPRFTILASLAAPHGIGHESFAILARPTNISDKEQSFSPCGYGTWTTDNPLLYFDLAADKSCFSSTVIKLKPGETFAGDLVLNVRLLAGNSQQAPSLPEVFRVGIYPSTVAACDNIVHGSFCQCGDANTSWSNTIPLNH